MKTVFSTAALTSLVIASAFTITSCSKNTAAEQAPAGDVFSVTTAKVDLAPMAATMRATGTLEGTKEASINSETQGRIVSVAANNGTRVGAGAALVTVDNELKSIAVSQAEAQRLSAEATLEKAQIDLTRTAELSKTGASTKSQYELAALQVKSCEAQLKSAVSAESLAKRQLSDATVRAPFAGVVAMRYVNLGEVLSSGNKVATIVDDSRMKLKIAIGELDLSSVKVGDQVSVTVDAVNGKTFDGKIVTVADKADAAHSYTVEVEIENPDKVLKSGMFARAEIKREADRTVPSIPAMAVINNGTRSQAYVVDEKNVAHLRGIKLGVTTADRAEIVEGLQQGDVVVTFGQSQLKDGVHVRTQN